MKRREFVWRSGAGVACAAGLERGSVASRWVFGEGSASAAADPAVAVTLRDPRIRALVSSILEASRAAGAQYADVRLTNTVTRWVGSDASQIPPAQKVELGLSVRALVRGYWGWAATPVLSTDEGVRAARLAATFATLSATRGKSRAVELGTVPVVRDGEWTTPVKVDPFTVDVVDLCDWCAGMSHQLEDLGASRRAGRSGAWRDARTGTGGSIKVRFEKQERVFASTEGNLLTQTVIVTDPDFQVPYNRAPLQVPGLDTPAQGGWERIADAPLFDLFRAAMDRADAAPPPLPIKPAQIGRYDMVFSAGAMATVLSQTLGAATELDRAVGYEANATGTSYLGPDPMTMLGTTVASPLVTVTAERSNPLGLATVGWDDEGVAPVDFPLVRQGRLVNYQTTREQAAWLRPWYETHGAPVRSLGCAMAPTALEVPMQHTPNLVLQSGPERADAETLVRDLDQGLRIDTLVLRTDWQCANAYSRVVTATEIRHGKPVARLANVGLSFRADQFWKSVEAVGGAASAVYQGTFTSLKGEPRQGTAYSIGTVPARIKQLTVIDPTRKA